MKKGKLIGRFAINLFTFWLVFMWRDGVISDQLQVGGTLVSDGLAVTWARLWEWLSAFGAIVLQALLDAFRFFVFLSPFGREIVSNPDFRYILIWCTVFVAVGAFIMVCMMFSESELHAVWNILITIAVSFGVWYACFGVCHLIILIPVWFSVLGALAAVLSTSVIFFGVLFFISEVILS